MKNIKLIVVFISTVIGIFGNSIYGHAGNFVNKVANTSGTLPIVIDTNTGDTIDPDSRAAAPATLQYIVKFRAAGSTAGTTNTSTATGRIMAQSTAQAAITQFTGKAAQIESSLSGQTFLVTFADPTQVAAMLNHMSNPAQENGKALSGNPSAVSTEAVSNEGIEIEYMVPNRRRAIALTPDDAYFTNQIQYHTSANNKFAANLEAAWNITTGSADVVIAVLDTGIRYDHPDLAGRLLPGYDFVSTPEMGNDGDGRDADPSDPGDWITLEESAQIGGSFYTCSAVNSHWHGTHVAGIIGATGNNQIGVAGANWTSKILPVRVLGKCGGYDSDIIDGIRWAAGLEVPGTPSNPTPANIINLSLGGSGTCDAAYQDAINEATAAGVIVVAAAGNQRSDANNFVPSNCNNVISVGSVSTLGNRASYANAGSSVTISSPGGDAGAVSGDSVFSTVNLGETGPGESGYRGMQGTSMAAAQVSGIVSLLISAKPELTPAEVRNVLAHTATPFPATSGCTTSLCGAGIINAFNALKQVLGLTEATPSQPETPVAPVTPVTPETPTIEIHTLFLPALSSQPNVMMTTPITTTPIDDGDFEQGVGTWQMNSSIGLANLILSKDQLPADRQPHTGHWMSWLGGMNDETSSISQSIQVPAEMSQLVFWKRVKSIESDCANDIAGVYVNGQPVQAIDLCASVASTTWSSVTVDLSAYAGQTVELKFQVTTDSADSSSLYLDDMHFQSK